MATNGANNVEDANMTECDGEKVVTMMDVLQEQQEFEEDAKAVLGASDDMNCTYSKGYIKRQAIYACLTCCADARNDETKRAGVCLACSLNCHENHELIELYTKRNFRCDCGNPKFNSNPCNFIPNKTELNLENNYNQNFSGIYCICHRPYPDPEATEEDEMIQCIICEDWLHANHLDANVPASDQYSEMICKACMEKNEFLHDYSILAVNIEMGDIDIVSVNGNNSLSYGTANNTLTNGDGTQDSVIEDTNKMETDTNVTQNDNILVNSEKEDKKQDSVVKDINDMETDTGMSQDKSILENSDSEKEDKKQDSVVKDINDMETDTGMSQDKSILENSEKENKEPTAESNPNNDTENIENVEKVAEDNIEEKNETDSEINAKLKVENSQSTNEVKESTTTESNIVVPETNTDKGENVENSETKDSENKVVGEGDIIKNDETVQNVPGNKDSENSDVNETKLENDAPKPNEVTKEIDSDKIDSSNKPENTDDIEKQLSDMHKEPEYQDVEAKPVAETPMDTTESEVNKKESNETSEVTAAAENSLEEPIEDKITSEVVYPESTDKDAENPIADITKPDSIETDKSDGITSMDNTSPKDNQNSSKPDNTQTNALELSDNLNKVNEPNTPITTEKRKSNEDPHDSLAKKPKLDSQCLRPRNAKRIHKGATFWPSTFRQKLCTCSECITMYKDLSVLFLIDPEDTVSAYETLGKEKFEGEPSTQYEKGLKALSSLDRIQQINALTEYNKMRDKLLDFLKSFKDKKEVVKEEDIRAFFAGMKPKREPDGVYFCR